MNDPRAIIEIPATDQMSQYGPVGIRLPDGDGQKDATQYFNSEAEAEEYLRTHPWPERES